MGTERENSCRSRASHPAVENFTQEIGFVALSESLAQASRRNFEHALPPSEVAELAGHFAAAMAPARTTNHRSISRLGSRPAARSISASELTRTG